MVAEKLNALKIAKATGSIPENINFAIKIGALRDFLDNNVVSYRTAVKTSEIASAARAYTVLVSCLAKQAEKSALKSWYALRAFRKPNFGAKGL